VDAEEYNGISAQIINAAMRIHSKLGPGLFESVYEIVLARDLARRGLFVERQKPVRFEFEGMHFDQGVPCGPDRGTRGRRGSERRPGIAPIHARQLLTCLRLLDCRLGLVLNFNALHLRSGIKRVANSSAPSARNPSA
jgi:iron complex transport system substrate-binding protein